MLPRAKISREIAEIRGIPTDRDCISPAAHSAFRNADEMLDFVESIAGETGLPVGIKSAVGDSTFWEELAALMAGGARGVDFITIDGGEGGTGAGPLVFTDHVALPFKVGFSRVQKIFTEHGVHQQIVFVGSGKLGFPEAALFAFALGCDLINVGREAMMAIGCIQAQRCHTNHCPTGVATQHPWLVRGLDPTLKAARLANYVMTLRKDAAGTQSCVRRAASVADYRRSARAAGRPVRCENHRRALRVWPRLRPAIRDRLRRGAPPDVVPATSPGV